MNTNEANLTEPDIRVSPVSDSLNAVFGGIFLPPVGTNRGVRFYSIFTSFSLRPR